MSYDPKELNFSTLLDGISDQTIATHHEKLYVGYVQKMNEIGDELGKIAKKQVDAPGNQTFSHMRALRKGETFATNGTYLHEYYFSILGGDGTVSDSELTQAIAHKWGSVEAFIEYMNESALSMRGWVVLCWDVQKAELKVYGCDAHDQGCVWGCLPILVLDVYEHAYFMDYGAQRKEYLQAFWKNLDWNKANEWFVQWKTISRK